MWSQEEKEQFNEAFTNGIGQINLDSKFGQKLNELCNLDEVQMIVDIGTWNGLGSTKIIANVVENSNGSKELYSYEVNREKFQYANALYLDDNIHIIHGSVLPKQPSIKQILDVFPELPKNSELLNWHMTDLENIKTTSESFVPENIDLLLLDGGELTTHFDFLFLKDRCQQYIMISGSNHRKGKPTHDNLSNDSDFILIQNEPNDKEGQGWSVFKRK